MYFLERLAGHILEKYGDTLQNLVVILPNIRAKLFLADHLRKQSKKAMFLPYFLSSQELMERISGLRSADDYFLLTKLFQAYPPDKGEELSFEVFMNWGHNLLQDLKEIDHQLIDAPSLFNQLVDIRNLEMWGVNSDHLSDFQRKYLEFCAKLPAIYKTFNELMENDGIGHLGFIERKAFESVGKGYLKENQRIILAGFNALTKAEEKIFFFLKENYKTEIFFDYDHYYVDNEEHEAGHFARINLKKEIYQNSWMSHDFTEIVKNIDVYRCTTNYEQSIVAGEILKKHLKSVDLLNTAIILPDESMLMPMLQALPADIKDVNITMGFSLFHSPYFNYFDSLFRMLINLKESPNGLSFYFKDVLRLMHTQGMHQLTSMKKQNHREFVDKINRDQQAYIPIRSLSELFEEIIGYDPFIDIRKPVKALSDLIRSSIIRLDSLLAEKETMLFKINREFLLHQMEVIEQVSKMTDEVMYEVDVITFHKIWRHYTKLSKVQFTGEPLIGLQIMGLLESRNLDFTNVIVLNANEGMLPSEKKSSSLIPNDLKKHFELNLNKEKDAVFAYHFYRLLQRAEKVSLIYSNQVDELGSGEKSRYIVQLEKELNAVNANHTLREITALSGVKIESHSDIPVVKTEKIIQVLKEKLEKGISPSSLSSYLQCPKNYFFSLLVDHRTKDEIIENIESDVLGKAVHKTMELLYKDHLGKVLKPADIKEMQKIYRDVLTESFCKYMSASVLMSGRNLLTFEMASRMVGRFLMKEEEYVSQHKIEIIDLEMKVDKHVNIELNGGVISFKVKGIIDRLEKKNGLIHLIDYKTGKTDARDLRVESLDELLDGRLKAFQLLIYSWLVSDNDPELTSGISASIYPFKSYSAGYLPLEFRKSSALEREDLNQLEKILKDIVVEMLEDKTPLKHHPESLYCDFC